MAFYRTHKKYIYLQAGFSLIELLTSISIVAIVSSFATPSFQKYIAKKQLRTTQIILRRSLSLARQTAISTGLNTYICELKDQDKCNTNRPFNANWSNGWLVYIDINSNAKLDEEDKIIHISHQEKPIGIIFNQRGRLRFRSNGSARSAGFYICNKTHYLHMLILYSGRTRTKELSKEDRIDKCKAVIN